MKSELDWFGLIALCHSRGRGDCLRNIEGFWAMAERASVSGLGWQIAAFRFVCLCLGIGQYENNT